MNVTWKIKVNGKEYGSVEEMPAAEREAYQRAMGQLGDAEHRNTIVVRSSSIVVNDREYSSVDAMPENVRQAYLTLKKTVEAAPTPTDEKTVAEAARALARPRTGGAAAPSRAPGPIAPESFSARKLIAWAAVLAVLAALYLLLRR